MTGRRLAVGLVAMLACAPFAGPQKSYAQTDQTIVMVCTNEYPGQQIFTLNLATKTVAFEGVTPNPGGHPDPIDTITQGTIQQITDAEIIFTDRDDNSARRFTLNRYTGMMSWEILDPVNQAAAAAAHAATGATCHKQQKQF